MSEDNDNHFLKCVTQLGDRQAVINHRDITSDRGLKLVAAGTRITSALYNKLVNHKLLPSLEQCLSTENSVDHAALELLTDQLLSREHSPFIAVSGELPAEWYRQLIRQIPLPAAIAFKLTVARNEREQIVVIEQEMQQLKKNLVQTGLVFEEHPESGADASWLQDDAEHLAEVTFLLKEAGWQLSDLYYQLHRRWPELNPSGALRNWIERLPRIYAR